MVLDPKVTPAFSSVLSQVGTTGGEGGEDDTIMDDVQPSRSLINSTRDKLEVMKCALYNLGDEVRPLHEKLAALDADIDTLTNKYFGSSSDTVVWRKGGQGSQGATGQWP